MIITRELHQELHQGLLRRLCCPVCLSNLFFEYVDEKRANLICDSCHNVFPLIDRLPYFLLRDENWKMKADEIEGEANYNLKTIPMEVHSQRNDFVDSNTDKFLRESQADISLDDVLIVGGSFPELLFFEKKCKNITLIDIVPKLTRIYFRETEKRKITADWVCGDGECLPFENETYDTVIVRQTLHHLLKYHSAICEFFRVCKIGGKILLIDEPYTAPDFSCAPLSLLSDDFLLYKSFKLGEFREECNVPKSPVNSYEKIDILAYLEAKREYIQPVENDYETLLSDKYLSFSILSCLFSLGLHSTDFELFWPQETAWVDMSAETPRFCHGPNPNLNTSLVNRLVTTGWASIAAKKTSATSIFRNRSKIQAVPIDSV